MFELKTLFTNLHLFRTSKQILSTIITCSKEALSMLESNFVYSLASKDSNWKSPSGISFLKLIFGNASLG